MLSLSAIVNQKLKQQEKNVDKRYEKEKEEADAGIKIEPKGGQQEFGSTRARSSIFISSFH